MGVFNLKKCLTVSAVVLISSLILGACSKETSKDGEEGPQELVVSTFGISEDVVKKDIFEPFEKANNVKIIVESGTSSERYTKLANNPNSSVDVIELAQGNAAKGFQAGLFAEVDEKSVPNMAFLTESAKAAVAPGAGPAYVVNSIGIIYNQAATGKELTEWADLWSEDLKSKVAIPDIATTYGPAMVYLANDQQKTDLEKDQGKGAFAGLKALEPNVVKTYGKSSDLINMLKSGEITAAVVGDFAVPIIANADSEVEYFVPASGTYANFNTVNVTKNSKNKELAQKFVDWRISQELQEVTAKSLNEAPTNTKVVLDEATSKDKTYGPVAERLKRIDFDFVNEELTNWIDQWNQTFNQ